MATPKTPGFSALAIAPLADDIVESTDVEWLVALTPEGAWVAVPLADATSDITNICTAMNGLNTSTDDKVPATADVVYVRADNSCGRAPLPRDIHGFVTGRAVTADDDLVPATDEVVLIDTVGGAVELTLADPAAGENNTFVIKKTNAGANAVTLTPESGTIEGGASLVFGASAKLSRIVFWDGTNWHVIGAF